MLSWTLIFLFHLPSWAHSNCEHGLTGEDVISVTAAPNSDVVLIPVFSDVHGKIATLFKALATLQQREKQTFPAVLIAGDLGAFPFPMRLSNSLRLAEIRSEEDLGFSTFMAEESAHILPHRSLRQQFFIDAREGLRLNAKFYFVRGNHEDHEYLKEKEMSDRGILPLDPAGIFNYLADGRIITLRAPGGHTLKLGGFGGVHADTRPGRLKDNPDMVFDQKAMQLLLEKSGGLNSPLDVLLTHQGPDGTVGGHPEIRTLVEILKPRLHLHGHADVATEQDIAGCPSVCVPKLSGVRNKSEGIDAVILEWNIKTNELKVREAF